jgi:hypothetical protein
MKIESKFVSVKAITRNPELQTLFLNLESSGIGVAMKKR